MSSPLRISCSNSANLLLGNCLEKPDRALFAMATQRMGRHHRVLFVSRLRDERVTCPRNQPAHTAADTPALACADEFIVIPATADPVGSALSRIAREKPITVGQCIRLVALNVNTRSRHRVHVIGQRFVEILERKLECSERLPYRPRRPEISMYIRGKNVVQQVPGMAIKRNTVEIYHVDDFGFVL